MPRTFNTEALNSDTIQVGSDALVVSENQGVGIGESNPEYKLEVRSTITNALRVSREGTSNQEVAITLEDGSATLGNGNQTKIRSFSGDLIFNSGGLERFRITENGNISVRDSSPYALSSYGISSFTISDDNGGTLLIKHTNLPSVNNIGKFIASKNGDFVFGRTDDGGVTPTTQLFIDNLGNASITQGTPYLKLYKNSLSTNSSTIGYSWLNLGNDGANDIICGKNNSGGYLRIFVDNVGDILSHNTSDGTEAVSINSSLVLLGQNHKVSFGNNYRECILFYGSQFAMGSQANTLYSRIASAGRFTWYEGGSHSNSEGNAGAGGTVLMTLNTNGLGINAIPSYRLHINGDAYVDGLYRGSVSRSTYGSISIGGVDANLYQGIDFSAGNSSLVVNTVGGANNGQFGVYRGSTSSGYWSWRWSGGNPGVLEVGTIPWARLTNIPTNAIGSRTISTANPTGGSDGDIWYKI